MMTVRDEPIPPIDTTYLIEPEAREFIVNLPYRPLTLDSLPALRAEAEIASASMATPAGVSVQKFETPALDGHIVSLYVFSPHGDGKSRPALLYIHGGGFVLGDVRSEADWAAWLAVELDCVVVSPEYRLAPEAQHPKPIEDCYAALSWMHAQCDRLSVDPQRIGVFGGSAGGGLGAAVALLARDRGEYSLRCQCLLYPMLDDRTGSRPSLNPYVGQFVWTIDDNEFGWTSLLGEGHSYRDVSPYAAPARAENLNRLPPTFIWTGALDLFLEEDIAYASRLLASGIVTEIHVFPGVTHGNSLLLDCPSTIQCRSLVLRFLRAKLAVLGRSPCSQAGERSGR